MILLMPSTTFKSAVKSPVCVRRYLLIDCVFQGFKSFEQNKITLFTEIVRMQRGTLVSIRRFFPYDNRLIIDANDRYSGGNLSQLPI